LSEKKLPYYKLNEEGFKKTLLILQLTRGRPMSAAQLKEETKIENIDHFIRVLYDMGYLEIVGRKSKKTGHSRQTKYRAVYRFQKIAGDFK